jgi:hypothetical protein
MQPWQCVEASTRQAGAVDLKGAAERIDSVAQTGIAEPPVIQ